MHPFLRIAIVFAFAMIFARAAEPVSRPVDRLQHEARGIYVLLGQNQTGSEKVMALPFLKGSQVIVQWSDLEPRPGHYDFSVLDKQLADLAARGWWATVQVSGNVKPEWLFDEVPHVKEKVHAQVRDKQGTLMFWHPRFQAAHVAMLTALAEHLKASPHRAKLLGLRLNFNAVGTDQLRVPAALATPDKWILPHDMDRASLTPLTDAVRTDYEDKVVTAYAKLFADWVPVFVRNNTLNAEIEAKVSPEFRAGRLALFHNLAEVEPRSTSAERQAGLVYDYARPGATLGYAEPPASAWGEHGGKNDPRWCSPAQWNYWTLLFNLHCGVSVIGENYVNLTYAATGQHRKDNDAPDSAGPQEFMAAYQWTADYVGRHNLPSEAPGAWVAFRENPEVNARNENVNEAGRKLARFTGDYDFLMHRQPGDGSVGVGPVGPADQRFGAFARRYEASAVAKLKLDAKFLRSLTNGATVLVTYLDEPRTAPALISLWTRTGSVSLGSIPFKGTGRWITEDFTVSSRTLSTLSDNLHITINAGVAPLTMHMVEVRRN